MGIYNGNRVRNQLANHDHVMRKRSGDQHMSEPEDDNEAPQRPGRISREAMEDNAPPIKDPDEPLSP